MIAILYQWRIREGCMAQFRQDWAAITEVLVEQGSHGSALFDAPDGSVVAIARWPDLATRMASSGRTARPVEYARMIAAVETELQELILDETLNKWLPPS